MKYLFTLLLSLYSINAATYFAGPSSAGNGSGNNLSNRGVLSTIYASASRGDTIAIIEGDYGSFTHNKANSTTARITIRKVNATQDSAVTGYASTLHDEQAVFSSIVVQTGYLTVNGITRTRSHGWTAPTDYGIRVTQIDGSGIAGYNPNGLIVSYCDIGGDYATNPSNGTIDGYSEAVYIPYALDVGETAEFLNCAMHNCKNAIVQAAGSSGVTIDSCDIGPGWGKEAIRAGNGESDNWVIKNSRFFDSTATNPNDGTSGITAEIDFFGDSGATYNNNLVYRNWFSNSKSGGRNSCVAMGGQGFPDTASGCTVINNTFAGIDEASVFSMILLSGSSNTAVNNLFSDCVDSDVSANTTGNNGTAATSVFQNYATLDLRLNQAIAGQSVSSPYNTDPNGLTSGSDGTTDRGAFEYDSGGGGGTTGGTGAQSSICSGHFRQSGHVRTN